MGHKFIHFLILASVLTMGFSGCGSSNNRDNNSSGNGNDVITTIDSNIIARHMTLDNNESVDHIGVYGRNLQQNDFNKNEIDWKYNNLEGLKLHVDQTYLYLQFTHNSDAPNIQFFLDIDNNPNTGTPSEGVDYMIENSYLYEFSTKNDLGWTNIGALKSVIAVGKSDTVAIKISDLKNRSVVFKAHAHALTMDWIPAVVSPLDGSKSIYTYKHTIDWSEVPTYATNSDKKIKIFDTDDNIYIYVKQDDFSEHIQIYIDSDNSSSTGYRSTGWESFGADYLVEDSVLYHYNAQKGWGWEFVGVVEKIRTSEDKSILEIAIPNKKLKNHSQKIKIALQTNNETWRDTNVVPKGVIPEYSLKSPTNENAIEISEVMAANSHTILDPDYFEFSDWIELHNRGDNSVDISGYKLSDTLNTPKWTIPEGTVIPADGYLLIWADDKYEEDKTEIALHTDFKLKMSGEAVALFDQNGKQIDAFEYLKQLPDLSVSLKDGKEMYMNPTPGTVNSKIHNSGILSQSPLFSLEEGFYETATTLVLSAEVNSTIYYTTDGSIPTLNSLKYIEEIPIDKTMSVRVMSAEDGKFVSSVVTKSYIVGENIDMPVVFITTDDTYLNDDRIGIYTVGTNGKDIGSCGNENPIVANYVQKWERPAHITLFEENKKSVLSQDIGIKLSGECSRQHAQKSFQLKSNDKYGKDNFDYQIFPDKSIKKFERFKLRNAGQDFIKTHMRDALIHMITKDQMNLNYEAYRPAVLFLNGEYWGLYGIREKLGKGYLKENFGVKRVNMLEGDAIVNEGSGDSYLQLVDYLRTYSLNSDENYNYIATQIDIDNYIDYMITNIYAGNIDRAGSNLIYWKEQKAGSKWQWLLHDTDFGFGLDGNYGVEYNDFNLSTAMDVDSWPNPEYSTLLFRKLLENSKFKTKFKDRFIQQMDTTFLPSRVKSIIEEISLKIEPQIEKHIDKWRINTQYSYAINSKEDWQKEVQKLKDYADQRPVVVKVQLDAL